MERWWRIFKKNLKMITYTIYTLIFFILAFVIYISFRGIKSNIELKKNISSNNINQTLNYSKNDILNQLKEANEMKKKGVITKKEFINIKKKILSN